MTSPCRRPASPATPTAARSPGSGRPSSPIDRGEVAEFRRYARALTADPADEGPAQVRLAAELFAGHLAVLDGRTDQGIDARTTVRAQLAGGQAPAPGLPGVATRLLLEGYALAGQPEAGLALASEALVIGRGMGRGAELWEAEIRRLRATFLAALGAPAGEVEAELERALAVARRQRRERSRSGSGNAHGTLRKPRWCSVDDRPEEER